MNRGKLIVIEGTDGSGKATQQQLLKEYVTNQNIPHVTFDFPRYKDSFFGDWLGRFLNGEFGTLDQIPPYLVAFPFAADRWQAKNDIEQALAAGKLVIINRYTSSNAIYQAAKLPLEKRAEFISWCEQLEYQEFGLPKEDVVLFLHVPLVVAQTLIEKKEKDIHERDVELLQTVEQLYLEFAKRPNWMTINCTENGKIRERDAIHADIVNLLKQKLGIS